MGNERLRDAVEGEISERQPVPFLCECADDYCYGTVELLLAEWEQVAGEPNQFVMNRGHAKSEGEEVTGSVRQYDVVRKPG